MAPLPLNPVPPDDSSPARAPEETQTEQVRKLFEEHNRALVTFLAARLHSQAEARDVAQEAYVRMLQLHKGGEISFLRAYLFRIASNLAVDRMRRRSVRQDGAPAAMFEELLAQPDPERVVLARQELEVVRQALRELPQKCRHAFAQYMFNDVSVADIAAQMGVSPRMIRHYIAEALAWCRLKRERSGQ